MEKHFEHNSSSVPPEALPDVVAMLKRIQQQLVFLEKKVDTLINQSSGRPFERKPFSRPPSSRPFERKPFSRPPSGRPFERTRPPQRSFKHSHRYGKGQQGDSSGERNFGQGRRFDKQEGRGNRRFGQRNKPFYPRRKERS